MSLSTGFLLDDMLRELKKDEIDVEVLKAHLESMRDELESMDSEEKDRDDRMHVVTSKDFGVPGYHNFVDMLDRARTFPKILNDPELFLEVLERAAEMEEDLESL